MEALVTVRDVCKRYGCSRPTARKYLRRMFHYEDPLAAPRWAFDEWERSRERSPGGIIPATKQKPERVIVPRKRG